MTREERLEGRRERRKNNIEKFLKKEAEYREKYKAKRYASFKLYYQKNKERLLSGKKEYLRKYKQTHKLERNQYSKLKYNSDVHYKLNVSLRARLNIALRREYKSGSAIKDLGCTIPELKSYLENQFQSGMNWNNWARDGWHIDHKTGLANFDLTDREQLLRAVHYTNLQPLWAKDNLSKNKFR